MRQQSQYLVEEIESDEDYEEEGRDGVVLHRGMHMGGDRTPTRRYDDEGVYDDTHYYSDEEREREELLLQSAHARIARARERGKTNVNLTEAEIQALERERMEGRRGSAPQALERRTIPLPELPSTPPITPAAALSNKTKDKVKSSSRSSSAASLKKSATSGKKSLVGASPAKSNSKAKVTRKSEPVLPLPQVRAEPSLPHAPPGMRLVNGPNGVPVYAPYDYPRISPSASRSRSGSHHRRDSVTPPREYGNSPPVALSTRYRRPGSSSSLRDEGGDAYGYAAPGRPRTVSNARSYQNMPPMYGYEYGEPPREHYADPVRYASLRRAAPPFLRTRSGTMQRSGSSGSSESEGQGVRVEVAALEGGGYAVQREDAVEDVLEEGKKELEAK
jgi:hypothetical protein